MLIHQLTDDECDAVLRRSNLGRLGCAKDNQPYVVPIYFTYHVATPDARYVYSFASLGQKIHWMRLNPLVCVEVDEVTNNLRWTSVIASGRFEELSQVDHPEAADRAYDLLRRRPDWWQPATGSVFGQYIPVVYRIRIDSLTGRRADRHERGTHPPDK